MDFDPFNPHVGNQNQNQYSQSNPFQEIYQYQEPQLPNLRVIPSFDQHAQISELHLGSFVRDENYQQFIGQASPYSEILLHKPQGASQFVQQKTKFLRDSIDEYFSHVPKVHSLIEQILPLLMPNKLLDPIKGLYDITNQIPLNALSGFGQKSRSVVVMFAQAIEKDDFMPKSRIKALKNITDAFLENDRVKRDLLKFGMNFQVMGMSISELFPYELFEAISHLFSNFQQVFVENFAHMLHQVPLIMQQGREIFQIIVQLLNPIELFGSFFEFLDKNKDGKISLDELVDLESHLTFFQNQKMNKSQLFSRLKKESGELVQLLGKMKVVENVISGLQKIDFQQMFKILLIIKDVIKKWSLEKIQFYLGKLREVIAWFETQRTALNKILNPTYSELVGIIVSIFYDEPEFVKQAVELFKDLLQYIDLEKVIAVFEKLVHFFQSISLFRSIEHCDFIGKGLENLQSLFARIGEIYQKIKAMIEVAVQRCLNLVPHDDIARMVGRDQLNGLLDSISQWGKNIFN